MSEVSKFKRVLCGDNWFGNILYPLWRDLDCVCCAMYRGICIGLIPSLVMTILYFT